MKNLLNPCTSDGGLVDVTDHECPDCNRLVCRDWATCPGTLRRLLANLATGGDFSPPVELLEVRAGHVNESSGVWCGARWPLHPLLACMTHDAGRSLSLLEVARSLHVQPATLYRVRREGLTTRMADEWATFAGRHPSRVWGELWWVVDVDLDDDELDLFDIVTAVERAMAIETSKRRHPSSQTPQFGVVPLAA